MMRSDQWSLLGSLGYGHLHVYVLPPGFEDFGRVFSFEEIGNDNFSTPAGMRHWFESAPNPNEADSLKLSVQVTWNESPAGGLFQQVKWREEGYGCAVITIDRKKLVSTVLLFASSTDPSSWQKYSYQHYQRFNRATIAGLADKLTQECG